MAVNAVSMTKKSRIDAIGLFAAGAMVVKLQDRTPPSAAYASPFTSQPSAIGAITATIDDAEDDSLDHHRREAELRKHRRAINLKCGVAVLEDREVPDIGEREGDG